jgi:hypothetical protein
MISMSLPSKAVRIGELSGKFFTNPSYKVHEAFGIRMRVSPWGWAVALRGGLVVIVLMIVLMIVVISGKLENGLFYARFP